MKEILITSSVLITALLVLRLVFAKKVRRTLIYAAWALVALRLLIPVQIGQLDFSVLTAAKPLTETVTELSELRVMGQNEQDAHKQVIGEYIEKDQTVFTPEVQERIESAIKEEMPQKEIAEMIDKVYFEQEIFVPEVQEQVKQQVVEKTNYISLGQAATMVWLVGVAGMAVWFAVANLRHGRMLRRNREKLDCESPIPVYVSEKVGSPCLVGLFRPSVYLTPESASDEGVRRHVLTHELTHYAHRDHIWSLVRCVCLCAYWFNPLVWVAAWFSRRDCELACDEGALSRLGEKERLAYGKSLLDVVSHASEPAHLMQTATAMNETKKQLKERVNFIVKKPKISITAAICMVLLCAMISGCVAVGPTSAQKDPPATTPTTIPTTPPTTVPSTTGNAQTTEPTQPENPNPYALTVVKKDKTYGYYDETLALVYNEKGQLLEYRAGYRKLLYTYDEAGNMSCRKMYNSAGELMEQTDYTYDAQGRLVQTEGFGYAEVYTTYKSEYIYDENGNLIHKKDYQNGELFMEKRYDAAGNLLEGGIYYGGGYDSHSVYTYDEAGKLQSVRTDRGGEPRSGGDYFYDEAGRLIREERFLISNGERKELTNTYTYDENGRCIRYDIGGYQGEQSYETYTYDDAGRMLSSEYHHYQESGNTGYYWTYDEEGRITSWKSTNRQGVTIYTWEYDEQGNVCKLIQDSGGMEFTYSFRYIWPEAELPQEVWEKTMNLIANFTNVSIYTPETYARININK